MAILMHAPHTTKTIIFIKLTLIIDGSIENSIRLERCPGKFILCPANELGHLDILTS